MDSEDSAMKVLTLHQPWASLIALEVKTIETRSWSTKYRGPLAIHAGARKPDFAAMKRLIGDQPDAWNAWYAAGMVSEDGDTDHMPLGAIVATCTQVDVVPIIGQDDRLTVAWQPHVAPGINGALWFWKGPSATENLSTGRPIWLRDLIEDQRPYGDFTPGRFAWLLADIVPVDPPVPFKGSRGLTKTWTKENS